MFDAIILGIVPSAWLVYTVDILRAPLDKKTRERWLLLLGATAPIILLVLAVWYGPLTDPARLLLILFLALSPALCGGLAQFLLSWFASRRTRSRSDKAIAVGGTIAALGITAMIAGYMPLPFLIVLCALLIAALWKLWNWAGLWTAIVYVVELVLLVITLGATDQHTMIIFDPDWFANNVRFCLYLGVPMMAVIMVACLFQEIARTGSWRDWPRILLMMFLCIPLIALLAFQVLLTNVWDVATDGLGSLFLEIVINLAVIAASMVLAWSLTAWRRWIALAFAIVVLLAMNQAREIANYYPSGAWGMMPGLLTERRAEMINNAIRGYYDANGSYPRELSDLIPRNLVYIPPPLIIPGQTWCYEGGHDYYRLAYKFRAYFSSPISVKVYAGEGNDAQSPECP